MIDCSLLILTYNNKRNLELMLPTVRQLLDHTGDYSCAVKIIQNGNCEESEALMKKYEEFEYINSENNYLFSYNQIVQRIESRTVFILNDDVKLSSNILNLCMPIFSDPKIFGISCLFYNWGTSEVQLSGSNVQLSDSWMKVVHQTNLPSQTEYCFYSSGGGSIYRTEMFNELGGFDEIYHPAYYEDTDLSHRAWHRGWETIVHPEATIEHRAGESWSNTKKERDLLSLQLRNKMIGMLVNVHSSKFMFRFLLALPYRLLYSMLFQPISFNAYVGMLKKSREILKGRKTNKVRQTMQDNYMREKLGKTYE